MPLPSTVAATAALLSWGLLVATVVAVVDAEGGSDGDDDDEGTVAPRPSLISFTAAEYNATIRENAVEPWSRVHSDVQMGVWLPPETSSELRFRIMEGNRPRLFKASTRVVGDFAFLLLRTRSGSNRVINREMESGFRLVVQATLKRVNAKNVVQRAIVNVEVEDENDNRPAFEKREYVAAVEETAELHTTLLTVSAYDADAGDNGQVYYSLREPTNMFAVHATTGHVTLTRSLSFVEKQSYTFHVLANDRRPHSLDNVHSAAATVVINVVQVNAYSPRIRVEKLPSVVEHAEVGTLHAIVYVDDEDYGANGQIESVRVIEGDPSSKWKLEQSNRRGEYELTLAGVPDRELLPKGFELTIEARDEGSPPRAASQKVHIDIADRNDHAPVFVRTRRYDAAIKEEVPVGTPVTFVTAVDMDIGSNGEVHYSFLESGDEWFAIDEMTGLISVRSPLDAELRPFLTLTVVARDNAAVGSRQSASVDVRIEIVDCNDNAPYFNDTEPRVTVTEGLSGGAQVAVVRALDADSGDNGYVGYTLVHEETGLNVPFEIEEFTGRILTSQALDYESPAQVYDLRIRAYDWGRPFKREAEMILRVLVRDVNDNRPRFERVNCTGYLSIVTPVGTTIAQFSAVDLDKRSIISYTLSSGDEDGCFDIAASNGVIRLRCDLRQMTSRTRTLEVSASDGTHTADPATLRLTLVKQNRHTQLANRDVSIKCDQTNAMTEMTDLIRSQIKDPSAPYLTVSNEFMDNAHVPVFASDTPEWLEVREDTPVSTVLTKLNVTDGDHGFNSQLLFVISSGNFGDAFVIDTYTGALAVMGKLDRELRDRYDLNVTVRDCGKTPLMSSHVLVVKLVDVNDCAPRFNAPSYEVSVSENVHVGMTILTDVRATDDDSSGNAAITFSLVVPVAEFELDSTSGVLTVAGPLDRESRSRYDLVIEASDSGQPPRRSRVNATVLLDDVNDVAPNFPKSMMTLYLREDMPVGSVLTVMSAIDPDLGAGGHVRYSLQDPTKISHHYFNLDRITGTVRLTKLLDFESLRLFNMTIRARDRGEPSLSSRCRLIVHVVDVNENLYAPEWPELYYKGSVREHMPRNTSVIELDATDRDASNKPNSRDGRVQYRVVGGSGRPYFTIDFQGVIRTNAVLDRETTASYWLAVEASDRAVLSRSSTTYVYIAVDDENDKVPLTDEPVYAPSVLEGSPEGTSVLQLTAHDDDLGANTQLRYRIVSGNPQGFFAIDVTTGLITTTHRKLDREQQEKHVLEVAITDGGTPALSSTTRVVVHVADVNDERPRFGQLRYTPQVAATVGRRPPGRAVYRLIASDADAGDNARLRFGLGASDEGELAEGFHVDEDTGEIYADRPLLPGESHELLVFVRDSAVPPLESRVGVSLHVLPVPADSAANRAPYFPEQLLQSEVMENAEVEQLVLLVKALDPDHERVWYRISDGNTAGAFHIHAEGNVVVAGRLDRERQSSYNLTVTATDGRLEAHVLVRVGILDVNDNCPEFSMSRYEGEVRESDPEGTEVLSVEATDADVNKQLFFTIHTSTDHVTRKKFDIHSRKDETGKGWRGVITTRARLNREAQARHELTVMVRDEGVRPQRSLARVTVHVVDVNEHAPQFVTAAATSALRGRLTRGALPGTKVLRAVAVDSDSGANAEITYDILDGNVGDVFSIDATSGTISLARPLPAVATDLALRVRAADGGHPRLASVVTVYLTVVPATNVAPRFTKSVYVAEISESAVLGSHVTVLESVSQSSLLYEVVGGNERALFSVSSSSGVLVTSDELDYEDVSTFELTVEATDMAGETARCVVLVHLTDANDNRPTWERVGGGGGDDDGDEDGYEAELSEELTPGAAVLDARHPDGHRPLVVRATDADQHENARLEYEIVEPEAAALFAVHPVTGAVTTRAMLDRETADVHVFSVRVHDLGVPQLSALRAARVTVHVANVNDCSPQFGRPARRMTLFLPVFRGVAVGHVHATDADGDRLTYSVDEGTHFSVVGATLLVNEPPKSPAELLVRVTASDGTFSSTQDVTVALRPLNGDGDGDGDGDGGLRFASDELDVDVWEEQDDVQEVAALTAQGSALNEQLRFRLLTPSAFFQISESAGILRTRGGEPLDRERRAWHRLLVGVEDMGNPPRRARALVNVTVLDVNDHAPVFVGQPYRLVITSETPTGRDLLRVRAVDRDVGENAALSFSLLANDGHGSFAIDRDTGAIRLLTSASDELVRRTMNIGVRVADRGTAPSLSSELNVTVILTHRDAPVFEQTHYNATLSENVAPQSVVTTVLASSADNNKLIYSIVAGDIYDEFSVSFSTDMRVFSPCSILVAEALDFETISGYTLVVRASDTATGLHSDVRVYVRLLDVNDLAPKFKTLEYVKAITEASPLGTSLLTVRAHDGDSGDNGRVSYSLELDEDGDSEFFRLNNATLRLRRRLDFETKVRHRVTVTAQDHGFPALKSSVVVTLVVLDVNDRPPRFETDTSVPLPALRLTDSASRGQLVTTLSAVDEDATSELVFSIVGGDPTHDFALDEREAILRVSERKEPQLQDNYTLQIMVSDGLFTDETLVSVVVVGLNHFAPMFERAIYEVKVAENHVGVHVIAQVHAVDLDSGDYGTVKYELADETNLFEIDGPSGRLSCLRRLDREHEPVHALQVTATDGGGRVGYATVRVRVLDVSDSAPRFTLPEYKANVYSNVTVGTVVLQMSAVDGDEGATLTYSLLEGSTSQLVSDVLAVDNRTGHVLVAADLHQFESDLFQFFVRVTDSGEPPQHATTAVQVYVMNPLLEPPSFPNVPEAFYVSEDAEVGLLIATVSATSSVAVTYALPAGNEHFAVNNAGELRVRRRLDRELQSMHRILLRVQTRSTPPLYAYTQVKVYVSDVNDFAPRFLRNQYHVQLAENTPVGDKILQVQAEDEEKSPVEYLLADSQASRMFKLDRHSGWLSLVNAVDRERQPSYEFVVTAVDSGQPAPLSSTTLVSISVSDHNDQPPEFRSATYALKIDEDAKRGTSLLQLETTDADLAPNNVVTYHIVHGDPRGQFRVRPSDGLVSLRGDLDREARDSYELIVAATDGMFVRSATVQVLVGDANDNAPQCAKPIYDEWVAEEAPLGELVARLTASDADDGENAVLTFAIAGDGSDTFRVDGESGEIRTARRIDRERRQKFELRATACDRDGLCCTSALDVTVTDINDNTPVFGAANAHTAIVSEGAIVNTLVTRVHATDVDLGENGKVKYAIDERQTSFAVDKTSGIVSVRQPLDRESREFYNLTIFAYDQGQPRLTASHALLIRVGDENDNAPQFESNEYKAEVAENAPVGTSVGRVAAASLDVGDNAVISYSLVRDDDGPPASFAVEPGSGVVRVAGRLDHERFPQFSLQIDATDGGSPPLAARTTMLVNVTDANDHAPTFLRDKFATNVPENAAVGHTVAHLAAKDADEGANAELRYRIVAGNEARKFAVDGANGAVHVLDDLDRETADRYTLTVEAADRGTPPLSSTTLLDVLVNDVNDNAPLFGKSNYSVVVQESESSGSGILKVAVTDADLAPNGAPFSFSIISGNADNAFSVSSDGQLTSAARFDRDLRELYRLVVRVFDNGSPTLFSDATVQVRVVGQSAFPPEVTALSVLAFAWEDVFAGGRVADVRASDEDEYDRLAYSVDRASELFFEIHPWNGTLFARRPLDSGEYRVNVSVTDGRFTSSAFVNLTVRGITPEMAAGAVVVRLASLTPEQFVDRIDEFRESVARPLKTIERHVLVLSVQPAAASSGRRRRRRHHRRRRRHHVRHHVRHHERHARCHDCHHERLVRRRRYATPDLDVVIVGQRADGNVMRSASVRRKISAAAEAIGRETGFVVLQVENDACVANFCVNGKCLPDLRFSNRSVVFAGSTLFPRHEMAARCQCHAGWSGDTCSQVASACEPSPCRAFHECAMDGELGYRCVCPAGRSGAVCEQSGSPRGDGPLAFHGAGFAHWRLDGHVGRNGEGGLRLRLELKTVQRNARLMHADGITDYSLLEMVNGLIQYRFNCGSGEGIVRIGSVRINDNRWHSVAVHRRGNSASLVVDDLIRAEGTAPGTNLILNLASNDVFFGAEVRQRVDGLSSVRLAFRGCMRNLRLGDALLPYVGSRPVATLLALQQVDFDCPHLHASNACSAAPCLNGGLCVPAASDFRCQCSARFSGRLCERDRNPCASSPCLHFGVCANLGGGGFACDCPGRLEGKRCEIGFYCKPNPCLNGATCEDGTSGPICHCRPGWAGASCAADVDECSAAPCQYGGTCFNTVGSFRCVCIAETGDATCSTVNFGVVKTSKWLGLTVWEIIGISCIVVVFFVLALAIICFCRCRRRRKRQNVPRSAFGDIVSQYNGSATNRQININNQLPPNISSRSSSPPPPPVPDRPSSYAPSNTDKLDNVLDYGTAGEELKTRGANNFSAPGFLPRPPETYDVRQRLLVPQQCEFQMQEFNKWDGGPKKKQLNLDTNLMGNHKKLPLNLVDGPNITDDLINENAPLIDKNSCPPPADEVAQGYHWDMSDWPQRGVSPSLSRLNARPVPDSPDSSRSNELNTSEPYDPTHELVGELPEEVDSEDVIDSEYPDDEDDDRSDGDDPALSTYEQLAGVPVDASYRLAYASDVSLDRIAPSPRATATAKTATAAPAFSHKSGYGIYATIDRDGTVPASVDQMQLSVNGVSTSDISGLCGIETDDGLSEDDDGGTAPYRTTAFG